MADRSPWSDLAKKQTTVWGFWPSMLEIVDQRLGSVGFLGVGGNGEDFLADVKEFAGRGPAAILLRLPRGIVLAKDPWGDEIGSMDPNYAAARSVLLNRDCGRLLKNEFRRTDVQMNRRKGAAK